VRKAYKGVCVYRHNFMKEIMLEKQIVNQTSQILTDLLWRLNVNYHLPKSKLLNNCPELHKWSLHPYTLSFSICFKWFIYIFIYIYLYIYLCPQVFSCLHVFFYLVISFISGSSIFHSILFQNTLSPQCVDQFYSHTRANYSFVFKLCVHVSPKGQF